MMEPSSQIPSGKGVPETFSEEDAPFDTEFKEPNSTKPDSLLLKETPARDSVDLKKFALGSSMLGWCIFLMFVCILLSFWNPDNELLKNGFEAFKLIVMTILGYIFGSNSTKQD